MFLKREESAGYMTNLAARLFARAIDARLKAVGFSSGHMPVLFALADGSECTQKVLAQVAAVEQPTMAATLARMQRDGLIARRPDPADGRASLFSLTPDALSRVGAVRDAAIAVNAKALSRLSEDEQRSFMEMLGRVAEALIEEIGEER